MLAAVNIKPYGLYKNCAQNCSRPVYLENDNTLDFIRNGIFLKQKNFNQYPITPADPVFGGLITSQEVNYAPTFD